MPISANFWPKIYHLARALTFDYWLRTLRLRRYLSSTRPFLQWIPRIYFELGLWWRIFEIFWNIQYLFPESVQVQCWKWIQNPGLNCRVIERLLWKLLNCFHFRHSSEFIIMLCSNFKHYYKNNNKIFSHLKISFLCFYWYSFDSFDWVETFAGANHRSHPLTILYSFWHFGKTLFWSLWQSTHHLYWCFFLSHCWQGRNNLFWWLPEC